ncbi:MAG: hypothetical protein R6T93_08055 [Trueperaceae bacterium]
MSFALALALAAGLTLTACGGGLDQSDVDALRERVETLDARLDGVVEMIETAREEADGELETTLDDVRAELQETRALLEEVITELTPPPPPEPVDPAAPAAPGGVPEGPAF